MRTIVVGMGELEVSDDPASTLVTYALGSCVAVLVHDPVRRAGGMIHYMLPLSTIAADKAKSRPAMFADTGIPLLFESMYRLGCRKTDLVVKVTGGASICDENGAFDIGRRNYVVVRKMFWKVGVPIAAEDVGGSVSRTARLDVGTGATSIRVSGQECAL